MDPGPHRPIPLPSCFWSGAVRGGTRMPSEGRRAAGVLTSSLQWLRPSPCSPSFCQGDPAHGSSSLALKHPSAPHVSLQLGVLMALSVP